LAQPFGTAVSKVLGGDQVNKLLGEIVTPLALDEVGYPGICVVV
jgi:hypothetical protein